MNPTPGFHPGGFGEIDVSKDRPGTPAPRHPGTPPPKWCCFSPGQSPRENKRKGNSNRGPGLRGDLFYLHFRPPPHVSPLLGQGNRALNPCDTIPTSEIRIGSPRQDPQVKDLHGREQARSWVSRPSILPKASANPVPSAAAVRSTGNAGRIG